MLDCFYIQLRLTVEDYVVTTLGVPEAGINPSPPPSNQFVEKKIEDKLIGKLLSHCENGDKQEKTVFFLLQHICPQRKLSCIHKW